MSFISQLIIRQLILQRHANFSWNLFVNIFYYHTLSDQIRSMHGALIGLCCIQGLLVLILLQVGYKNKVKNTISNIIHAFLAFIGLRVLCFCHRNFSFALRKPAMLLVPSKVTNTEKFINSKLKDFYVNIFMFCES
jgi:hypothetical protein